MRCACAFDQCLRFAVVNKTFSTLNVYLRLVLFNCELSSSCSVEIVSGFSNFSLQFIIACIKSACYCLCERQVVLSSFCLVAVSYCSISGVALDFRHLSVVLSECPVVDRNYRFDRSLLDHDILHRAGKERIRRET